MRAACRSPAWAYQACAEPGDKLPGRHSWEAANFCSLLSDYATASFELVHAEFVKHPPSYTRNHS
eukprot:scaffold120260_cov66-Phaeocystis_antarctica.AAC.1